MAGSEIKMKMSLDSSKVKTALTAMGSKIKDFSQKAATQFGNVAKAASLGLVAAFTMATRKAISLGSYLSDVAESTGFATEQFQVFRGALIDAGGKAESMEKAIIMMQKAVVQGSEGMMTYTRAFNRLGLSVDDLKRMKPEDQFQVIAKAIAGAENQQKALASAMEIFGAKNAPRLIEVFKRLDKDGYGKMAEDIEKTYGIMTAETQKSLDRAADIIERFKQKAVIKVADLISGEANFAGIKAFGANLMAELAKAKESFLNGMVNGFYKILGTIRGALDYISDALPVAFSKGFNTIISKWGDKLNKLIPGDLQLFDVEGANAALADINKGTKKTFAEYIKDGQEATKAAWQFDASEQINGWREVANTYKGIRDINRQIAESQNQIKGGIDGTIGSLEKVKSIKEYELDLAEALADGDKMEAGSIRDRIELEKEIQRLLQLGVGLGKSEAEARKEAERVARRILENQKEMERAEEALLDAQLEKNDALIHEEQKRLDLLKSIDDIMKSTGKNYDDAVIAAQKLAKIKFGADLNMSGFITPREQREFERQEKERERKQRDRQQAELREERLLGGGLLGKQIPEDIPREDRRRRDAEDRARRADLREVQRRERRGEDREQLLREIDQRREARQRVEAIEDRRQRDAEKRLLKREEDEIKRRQRRGEDMDKIMEDIAKRRAERDEKLRPPAPGVPKEDPVKPQKPKSPEDLIYGKFEPILTEMKKHLDNIDRSLRC